jgi:DNA-binding HxlR family transcriptional regulator
MATTIHVFHLSYRLSDIKDGRLFKDIGFPIFVHNLKAFYKMGFKDDTMDCCMMKGHLSFLLMWLLSKKKMNGVEIAKELEGRKGSKPSPGTLYPALKDLKEKGLIDCDEKKVYSLTKKGEEELKNACNLFHRIFHDIGEMGGCCGK